MKRCEQQFCRGSIVNEGDRESCLLCGRVYRDDARMTDAAHHALLGLGSIRTAHMTGASSSRRYTTEARTDGLIATKGYHDA